ncbi:hypothetical protein [Moraxella marmotae]|uniref:hypothetical protein n=1 Tax=Moraxella marmotae TaxID=3344520 RepID=UPI0035F29957
MSKTKQPAETALYAVVNSNILYASTSYVVVCRQGLDTVIEQKRFFKEQDAKRFEKELRTRHPTADIVKYRYQMIMHAWGYGWWSENELFFYTIACQELGIMRLFNDKNNAEHFEQQLRQDNPTADIKRHITQVIIDKWEWSK